MKTIWDIDDDGKFSGDFKQWNARDHDNKVDVLHVGGEVLLSHYMGNPTPVPAGAAQLKDYANKVERSITR